MVFLLALWIMAVPFALLAFMHFRASWNCRRQPCISGTICAVVAAMLLATGVMVYPSASRFQASIELEKQQILLHIRENEKLLRRDS